MSKFYAPTIFVIEAEDQAEVEQRLEAVTITMAFLRPQGFEGDMQLKNLPICPASEEWGDIDQAIELVNGEYRIVEKEKD